jgi:hypothetical protein
MTTAVRVLTVGVALVGTVAGRPAHAQLEIGTWVRKATAEMPAMTMTIEACCNGGRKLTYHIKAGNADTLIVIETQLDGTDSQVVIGGQRSGQTMAIKREDEHHASTILRMNGVVFGTAKSTLSPDGKTLTTVDEYTSGAGGVPVGKYTEIWTRQ